MNYALALAGFLIALLVISLWSVLVELRNERWQSAVAKEQRENWKAMADQYQRCAYQLQERLDRIEEGAGIVYVDPNVYLYERRN